MKAQELRIGNFVFDKNGGIHEIGFNCFQRFRYPSMDGNPSGFSPIPLTEDWLLRFGGKKNENFDYRAYRLGKRILIIRDGNFVDYGSSVVIKFVHKLQNFLFEVEGKELQCTAPVVTP